MQPDNSGAASAPWRLSPRPHLHGSSPYGSSRCGPGPQPQATECAPIAAPSSRARQDLPAFETFDEIVIGEGEGEAAISGCPEGLTRNHGDFDLLQEQGG